MGEQFGYSDEQALIVAGQQGDLRAGEQIVRRYQSDLLRTAYLLTDSATGARGLARAALEQAFADLRKLDPDRDFRPWLLNRLAVQFLYGAPVSQQDGQPQLTGFVSGGAAQHFNVDNDRSRFREALMRMDDRDRLLLILHEFNGLPVDSLSRPLGEESSELEQRLQQARQRIRQAASIPDERSLPVALNEAAIDAPRIDLWPELVAPIEELNERERFRFRLLTGSAVGVVGVVLLTALVLLLNGALGSSDPDESGGAADVSQAPLATESPLTSTNAPAATPATPDGDVSDQLLTIPMRSSLAGQPITFFDPDSLGTGLNRLAIDGRIVGISHDGSQVYILTTLSESGSATQRVLAAIDTRTLEQVWATSLGPASPLSSDDFTIDIVTTGSAVYAALNDNLNRTIAPVFSDTEPVVIVHLDKRTGDELNRWEIEPAKEIGAGAIDARLFHTARDGASQLVLLVEPRRLTGTIEAFMLRLPDMAVQRRHTVEVEPTFDSSSLRLSPDGRVLYQLPGNWIDMAEGELARLHYLEIPGFGTGSIELPFTSQARGERSGVYVESTPSHDGRWLYVAAPNEVRVAIIDLDRMTLAQNIVLDSGLRQPPTAVEPATRVFAADALATGPAMQLSLDGLRLYLIGPSFAVGATGDTAGATAGDAVWEIDTTLWTVSNLWLVGEQAGIQSITLSGDDQFVYASAWQEGVREGQAAGVACCALFQIDTLTGESTELLSQSSTVPSTLNNMSDIYRAGYGKSPSVDGVIPVDNRQFTVLPEIAIEIDPEAAEPGSEFDIRIWFRDPAGQGPVQEGDANVRFDPTTSVGVLLTDGITQQFISLVPVEHGVYTARMQLQGAGSWGLTVQITAPDGGSRTVTLPGAVQTRVVFPGSDGRFYQMQLVTIPAEPAQGDLVELILSFVDTETGERTPADVSIDLNDADRIGIFFTPIAAETAMFFPAALYPSGPNLYTGSTTMTRPGQYTATVEFIYNSGVSVGNQAGTVVVQPE